MAMPTYFIGIYFNLFGNYKKESLTFRLNKVFIYTSPKANYNVVSIRNWNGEIFSYIVLQWNYKVRDAISGLRSIVI